MDKHGCCITTNLLGVDVDFATTSAIIIIIIINKVLIKVTLNKVIARALYIVICG